MICLYLVITTSSSSTLYHSIATTCYFRQHLQPRLACISTSSHLLYFSSLLPMMDGWMDGWKSDGPHPRSPQSHLLDLLETKMLHATPCALTHIIVREQTAEPISSQRIENKPCHVQTHQVALAGCGNKYLNKKKCRV